MLKTRALVECLGQAATEDVTAALLFSREGVLLAYNGFGETKANADVSSALISNIWESFDRKGVRDELKEMFITCENGSFVCMKVANTLLCLKTKKNARFGMVRLKLRQLASHLEQPLNIVIKNV